MCFLILMLKILLVTGFSVNDRPSFLKVLARARLAVEKNNVDFFLSVVKGLIFPEKIRNAALSSASCT